VWGVTYQEHLGDVAGAEDLMHGGELVRLQRREVRREGAFLRAPSPEQLARGARYDGIQRRPRPSTCRPNRRRQATTTPPRRRHPVHHCSRRLPIDLLP
jgi:hypothetical protein